MIELRKFDKKLNVFNKFFLEFMLKMVEINAE